MLFFQRMTRRYGHASTVLTPNKGFQDWGDAVMAAALIDRLAHHCHLVTIRGNRAPIKTPSHPQTARRRASSGVSTTEARLLVDLSGFHPAGLADFGPELTIASFSQVGVARLRPIGGQSGPRVHSD
jgi:hypothetical protein